MVLVAGSEPPQGRTLDRLRKPPVHVLPIQQIGDFHRRGLQLAGVKCQLVTEVRPLP